MSFPYTYNNKIELFGDKIKGMKPDISLISNLLYNEILNIHPIIVNFNNDFIEYSDKATVFRYEYTVKFNIKYEKNDINIYYQINFAKLLNITLVAIILIAFFSFVSVKYFLIIAGLFSISFYIINLLYINAIVKNLVEKAVGSNIYDFNEKEYISDEQKKWIKDVNRCPACGEYIINLDLDCPDCGLRIKRNRNSLPIDSSKFKDKEIKFHYRKKH